MAELQTLMTGIGLGESPRWHGGCLSFCDWGAQEGIALDLEGKNEVVVRMPSMPFCIDWLPDGRMLIVSARDGLLLRREHNGSLATYADLTSISRHPEVTPDGSARQTDDDIAFPNVMVVTPDNRTLVIAESYGARLTALDTYRASDEVSL